MLIKSLEEVRMECTAIDVDDEFYDELLWEMSDDLSEFVCAEICYKHDNSIFYLNVYTENYIYIFKQVTISDESITIWASAPRVPWSKQNENI